MITVSRFWKSALAGSISMSIIAQPVAAAPADPIEKPGSLYLQCDGQPNNMTAGESAARLLGAVTLLALFAPAAEGADASKRKFGADGVAACSALLDGDKKEGNPARRIGLFLARALHGIEAKQYQAALSDVTLARAEAVTAALSNNPYYERSQGRAADLIESAALFRLGRAADARDVAVRSAAMIKHSSLGLLTLQDYLENVRTGSPAEADYLGWKARVNVYSAGEQADRLEELGQFTEAAKCREALVDFNRASVPDTLSSSLLARSAVTLAIAGNRELAATRAKEARDNFEKRKADGKPDKDPAEFVELMDLYGIVEMTAAGDAKGARRLFSARSQWVAASFGGVLEMTRRLRAGAAADELIGGLSRDPELMWKDRADAAKAALLAKDANNKELFWLIPNYANAGTYEALSKRVWNTKKSSIVLKTKQADERKMETLFIYGVDSTAAMEAYVLHAALLAKSRGHQGFVFVPVFEKNIIAALIMTGNRGAPGFSDILFNDAETVITDLSPILPDPETLKARKAAKS